MTAEKNGWDDVFFRAYLVSAIELGPFSFKERKRERKERRFFFQLREEWS